MSRKEIPEPTARLVLARSGGFCANPSCRADLFPEIADGRFSTIQEMAHIVAQSLKGPRGASEMPLEARNDGSNVVLLCPTCHERVDEMEAVDVFTEEVLLTWKREHEERVRHSVSVPRFDERADLNTAVAPLLRRNKGITDNLGPQSAAGNDPLGAGVDLWRDQVVNVIIPNNQLILAFVDANAHLFEPKALELVELFRVHAAARALNYTSGRWLAGMPRFPVAFTDLFSS